MGCGGSKGLPDYHHGNVVIGNGKLDTPDSQAYPETPQSIPQSDDSLAVAHKVPSDESAYSRGPIKVLSIRSLKDRSINGDGYTPSEGLSQHSRPETASTDHGSRQASRPGTGAYSDRSSRVNSKTLPRSRIPGVTTPLRKQESSEELFETIHSTSPVKVTIVVRPLRDHELADSKNYEVISVVPPDKVKAPGLKFGGKERGNDVVYQYDRVYKADTEEKDKQLFMECIVPLLDRFCQGFNATVFAYGQTGAGKTYTMGNTAVLKDFTTNHPQRIVPRSVHYVFKYMAQAARNYDIVIKAQYYEIYNEAIRDLLEPEVGGDVRFAPKPPTILERDSGEVYVENLTEVTITALSDIAALLSRGNERRVTGAHNLNEHSSRSHAILTFHMEQRAKQKPRDPIPLELRVLRSKLNLVDLAGSERMSETGAQGARAQEGININKGLLELGNVINALSAGWKHIPYRNSKLTRVLRDSLGGNTETLMVACVAPGRDSHEHTLSTLRYALRARNIKNVLKLNNQVSLEEEIAYLRKLLAERDQEIADLKLQVKHMGESALSDTS